MSTPDTADPVTRLRDSLVDAVGLSREVRARLASLEAQNTALTEALRKAEAERGEADAEHKRLGGLLTKALDENEGLRAELNRLLERADAACAADAGLDDAGHAFPDRLQCCPMDTYGTDSAGDPRPVCTCGDGCECTCPGCRCGTSGVDDHDD